MRRLLSAGALAVLAPGQQQGRRWPSSSSSWVRRMRRSRVISCLASSTQQMNSLRARGVMSFQASSAVGWRSAPCAGLLEACAPPHRALAGCSQGHGSGRGRACCRWTLGGSTIPRGSRGRWWFFLADLPSSSTCQSFRRCGSCRPRRSLVGGSRGSRAVVVPPAENSAVSRSRTVVCRADAQVGHPAGPVWLVRHLVLTTAATGRTVCHLGLT